MEQQLGIDFTAPSPSTQDVYFEIKGGIWPVKYRTNFIKVTKVPVEEFPYDTAKNWCKTNFPDWNHIGICYNEITPEQIIATIPYTVEIPRFVSSKRK